MKSIEQVMVQRWMLANFEEYVDPHTNTINLTLLAESAAQELDLYDRKHNIPEELYDAAFQIERILSTRKMVSQI